MRYGNGEFKFPNLQMGITSKCLNNIFTARKRCLGQGYIFPNVLLLTGGGGLPGRSPWQGDPPRRPPSKNPPTRETPKETSCKEDPLRRSPFPGKLPKIPPCQGDPLQGDPPRRHPLLGKPPARETPIPPPRRPPC